MVSEEKFKHDMFPQKIETQTNFEDICKFSIKEEVHTYNDIPLCDLEIKPKNHVSYFKSQV